MGQLYRVASAVSDSRLGFRFDFGCGEESTLHVVVSVVLTLFENRGQYQAEQTTIIK